MICRAEAAFRPGRLMRPALTIFCLVTPTCPITGMPAAVMPRIHTASREVPSKWTPSAPPSFIKRVAVRTASSGPL